ncbi:MAG: hypothetical protein ACLP0J_05565 [Solirubrobacteraceae bacterium]
MQALSVLLIRFSNDWDRLGWNEATIAFTRLRKRATGCDAGQKHKRIER